MFPSFILSSLFIYSTLFYSYFSSFSPYNFTFPSFIIVFHPLSFFTPTFFSLHSLLSCSVSPSSPSCLFFRLLYFSRSLPISPVGSITPPVSPIIFPSTPDTCQVNCFLFRKEFPGKNNSLLNLHNTRAHEFSKVKKTNK